MRSGSRGRLAQQREAVWLRITGWECGTAGKSTNTEMVSRGKKAPSTKAAGRLGS